MLNFFAIVLIIFIVILLLVLRKRSFQKLKIKSNLYSIKLNKNNKFKSDKIIFLYTKAEKSPQYFIKILKERKFLVFFRVIQK